MKNIGFIGLGKLGLPCAEEIAKKGHKVFGYDNADFKSDLIIKRNSVKELVKHGYDDPDCLDILFIAVPTPHEKEYDGRTPTSDLKPKDFDYTIVKSVLQQVNNHSNSRTLVALISTVLPGTVRRELINLIPRNRFVYNPYLIAMGTVGWDMVNPEMVMIGTNDGDENTDAKELIDFYKTIMDNNPRYVVGTWDEMECVKIFYNTFISTKIALVNMVQDVAERQGNIDVDVVTKALADSTHRIMSPMYMTAGMGDGGNCHPRDNIALRWMAKELDLGYDLFDSIMKAREVQAENMAKKLVSYKLPVIIMGKSYKPGVEYEDGSSSILVGHYVKDLTGAVFYDTILDQPAVYLMAHPQDEFNKGVEDSVVVDPWRKVRSLHKTYYYGNTRRWLND